MSMGILSRIFGIETNSLPQKEDHGSLELREKIEAVLEAARPTLHMDGGDIELVDVIGHSAKIRLKGACSGCSSAALTLREGIEKRLKEEIPEFEDLIPI